jgi:hypothetical protein
VCAVTAGHVHKNRPEGAAAQPQQTDSRRSRTTSPKAFFSANFLAVFIDTEELIVSLDFD